MTARGGHACDTQLEQFVCAEMQHQGLPHEHRSLHFRVADDTGGKADYTPAIVARRGSILFLVDSVESATDRDAIHRFSSFLEQHSPELVLVLVATDDSLDRIPPEAYDEVYAASDVGKLTARIRSQDPKGIIRPFEKPSPRDSAR